MSKPDAETIFPRLEIETDKDGASVLATGGMTLRDYFAGQALKGMLACQDFMNELCQHTGSRENARAMVSCFAYRQADSMLAEREKT